MKDLTNPTWIKFKGILFFVVGLAASILLLLEHPTIKLGVLLAIAIWCLWDFFVYLLSKKGQKQTDRS
jgi:hypothetical protein